MTAFLWKRVYSNLFSRIKYMLSISSINSTLVVKKMRHLITKLELLLQKFLEHVLSYFSPKNMCHSYSFIQFE